MAGRLDDWRTDVYDFSTGEFVGYFFGTSMCFAMNEGSDLIATVRNDEGGAEIRFVRITSGQQFAAEDYGWGAPRVKVSSKEDEFGWSPRLVKITGMTFSPKGNAFAIVGGMGKELRGLVVKFPKLSTMYEHKEYSDRIRLRENMWGPPETDRGNIPIERAVFDRSEKHVYIPLATGAISVVDLAKKAEISRLEVHEGLATSLDFQYKSDELASVSSAGEIALIKVGEGGKS